MIRVFPIDQPPSLVAIDVETSGLNRSDDIVTAAIAWYDGKSIHAESFWLDRYNGVDKNADQQFRKILNATLFNASYSGLTVFHNLDFDLKFLLRRYFEGKYFSSKNICSVADTMTISRVAKNNKFVAHADPKKLKCHSLKFLAKEYLNHDHKTFDDVVSGSNIRFANRSDVLHYNEEDARLTLELYLEFKFGIKSTTNALSQEEWNYIDTIETPHLLNSVHMNFHGVPYDVPGAYKLLEQIDLRLTDLENQVFKTVGRSFNISSQRELASALFHNHNLTYEHEGSPKLLMPLYVTDKDQKKVDLETLKEIRKRVSDKDPKSMIISTLDAAMQCLELIKARTLIEIHLSFCEDGQLYPNFSADAKSGRNKCSKPNLIGIGKRIFKKSEKTSVPPEWREKSVRDLIRVPDDYRVHSIDISALDLSVVTFGAKEFNSDFMWVDFFKRGEIDIHMAVSRAINEERFKEVLMGLDYPIENLEDYWVLKPDKSALTFVSKNDPEIRQSIPYKQSDPNAYHRINTNRTLSKVINLSTGYLTGALKLALKIKRDAEIDISVYETQEFLNRFYEEHPEIRLFQDQIGNQVYAQGYVQSIFGRKYYAEVFDELNEQFRNGNQIYEFVCLLNGKYWYIKASKWLKSSCKVIENLKIVESPFGLRFKDIICFQELNRYTFRKRGRKKKSKFDRKSEDNLDEISDFELTRIGITNEIDNLLLQGMDFSQEAIELMSKMIYEGDFQLSEKCILLYRTKVHSPSSRYFKFYKKLIKSVREFFPLYCQGVASSLASMCLTEVRKKIENDPDLDARLLLFVHDQIDVMVWEKHGEKIRQILTHAVEMQKLPFDVPLKGELEDACQHIK